MATLRELLQIEHNSEHDLATKKNYGKVSIYDAKGNLSARWYIYYSFRNPETGYLERQPNVYMNINDFDTLRERTRAAKIVKESLEKLLQKGFNPYNENPPTPKNAKIINSSKSVNDAIAFSLTISKKILAESSYTDHQSRVTQFKNWLIKKNLGNCKMADIEHETVMNFLNEVLQRSSARNRNNTRTALASMYKILLANKIVKINIVEGIDKIKSTPQKNKTYTAEQEEKIL